MSDEKPALTALAEWGRRMTEAINQIRIDPRELARSAVEHYNARMDYINGCGPDPDHTPNAK